MEKENMEDGMPDSLMSCTQQAPGQAPEMMAGHESVQHPKGWNLWKKTETGVLDKKI